MAATATVSTAAHCAPWGGVFSPGKDVLAFCPVGLRVRGAAARACLSSRSEPSLQNSCFAAHPQSAPGASKAGKCIGPRCVAILPAPG